MSSILDLLRDQHPLAVRRQPPRPSWLVYGVAVGAPVLASALSLALRPYLMTPAMALFAIGVVLAAWMGGLRPALLTTALSIVSALVLPFAEGTGDLPLRLAAFAGMGLVIGVAWESTSRTRLQAVEQASVLEDQALELELANQELTESIDEAQCSREAAEVAEQRYRLLFERNPVPMWVYDLESLAFLAVNDAAVAHYGFSREEFLGMTLRDIRPAADVPSLLESHRTVERGLAVSGIFRHRKRDGSLMMASIHSHEIVFDGRAARLVLANDVTERLRIQEELRTTSERLQAMVDASPLPIVAFDPDKTVLSWNRAAERTFGWTETEVVGKPFPGVPPEREAESRGFQDRIKRGQSVTGVQTVRRRRDGSPVEVRISTAALRGARGEFAGFVAVYEDTTERRRTEEALQAREEQLRQAQKMEAVGRLAGGVAHDFNNILTAIHSYAELLELELGPGSAHLADVQEIQKAAERAAGLTRQLLAFSRQQVLQPRVLDVNTVVAETERMLGRLIGADVELVTRLDPQVGRVQADPGQLSQVVLNLALNARDAMPSGGRLLIETGNVELDDVYASAHRGAQPGPHVLLSVSDTGTGMDAATQARIFEPFFTTKQANKGTGLGLATVYGIVQQSGGSIWVYSEPGHGTTFKVYLPQVADERADAATSSRVAPSVATPVAVKPGTTILIVEDESNVRKVARRTLVEHGYSVLEAENGREALEIAAAHPGAIDLVITDMVMPEMKGGELVSRLRQERPEARILMMSGYTAEAAGRQAIIEAGNAFLEKPFTASHLLDKVQDLLRPA